MFSNLTQLEQLSILNSTIEDLKGISQLHQLFFLRLGNLKKVKSLVEIKNLTHLEELEIQRCKEIDNISSLFSLANLKKLSLIDLGNINTIRGIESLYNLQTFIFYGTTNIIDGDLLPITNLKKLEKISYQNRKHYTHKRESFGKIYN